MQVVIDLIIIIVIITDYNGDADLLEVAEDCVVLCGATGCQSQSLI